jgi:hypothetical protein
MPHAVFNIIKERIIGKGLFHEKVANFSGKKGIHPLVRLTVCICRLAYGDGADRDDKNLDMAESTINITPCTMCSLDRSYTESEFLSGTHLKLN